MRQLGIFAKYWKPGEVKTRLAASIGDTWASRLSKQFLEMTIARLEEVPADKSLCFWPIDSEEHFRPLTGQSWMLVPQADGDLGSRLGAFFTATCQNRSSTVVVGSDSPDLPIEFVEEAFQRLTDADVVVGPTMDGGYFLIGMSRPQLHVFHDIPWSTSSVLDTTLERCRSANLRCIELPAWRDVDELEDLKVLRESLLRDDSKLGRDLLESIDTCLSERSP